MTKDIPLTAGLALFTPKDWEDKDPLPVIRCRIPDFEQRDLFYGTLHSRGIRYNGRDQQRALMRRALRVVYPDADEAEAMLAICEGVWQRTDEDEKEVSAFLGTLDGMSDEEKDKRFDEWRKDREPALSDEESGQYRDITTELLDKYPPMVRLNEENARHQIESSYLSVQRFVVGWDNLPKPVKLLREKGELARGSMMMLRGALGTAIWNDLVNFIGELMVLDPDAEGNFVWPPVSGSGQTPSPIQTSSTKGKKESGKSTAEPTA